MMKMHTLALAAMTVFAAVAGSAQADTRNATLMTLVAVPTSCAAPVNQTANFNSVSSRSAQTSSTGGIDNTFSMVCNAANGVSASVDAAPANGRLLTGPTVGSSAATLTYALYAGTCSSSSTTPLTASSDSVPNTGNGNTYTFPICSQITQAIGPNTLAGTYTDTVKLTFTY